MPPMSLDLAYRCRRLSHEAIDHADASMRTPSVWSIWEPSISQPLDAFSVSVPAFLGHPTASF
jgi:hypothetical protein